MPHTPVRRAAALQLMRGVIPHRTMPFLTLIPNGFFLEFSRKGLHAFCGTHGVPGAECPNCHLPLHRYLDLDTRDPVLSLPSSLPPILPLLFCWRCRVAQRPLYYQLRDGGVKLLKYGKGMEGEDFPYSDYPVAFPPARARLRALTPTEAKAIRALNKGADDFKEPFLTLSVPAHQIGGEPLLLQGDYHSTSPKAATCPTCRKPMPFLAAFGDRCLDRRGFVSNEFVQVLFSLCPRHWILSAHQACD